MKDIFTGKTVDECKAEAVSRFGVAEDRITFEILEEPKKSLFGTKGIAKLEAEFIPEKKEVAQAYIDKIVDAMGLSAVSEIQEVEGGAIIDYSGDDAGMLIGKRGECLDALQYLGSMVCNRADKDYYRICVDAKGYRAKRMVTLQELAKKIASSVLKTGYSAALEPMNPYERRIIHSTVSEIEGVSSRSVGEEPFRKVVISSDNAKVRPQSADRTQRSGSPRRGRPDRPERGRSTDKGHDKPRSYDKASKDYEGARELDLRTSFEKDYKRPRPEDNINAGLYGKIEF